MQGINQSCYGGKYQERECVCVRQCVTVCAKQLLSRQGGASDCSFLLATGKGNKVASLSLLLSLSLSHACKHTYIHIHMHIHAHAHKLKIPYIRLNKIITITHK